MQKNWRKKILTVIGILAGAFVLSTAVDPTSVSAEPDAMEEIIGHGEWKQDGDQWYYYQDGEILKNCWVKDGINWFILNNDGSMKADELLVIDGDLYYFRSWGAMLYNSWHMDAAGNLYYFRDWGGALNTGWKELDGAWYYFDRETCRAHADCVETIEGNVYAFDENGIMKHDVWVQDNGKLYYLRDWGAALNIGWRQMDGEWYYFDQETCAAYADTIRKIDNDVYGFDADGKMLHDCWAEADGIHYYFRGWGGAFHDQTVTIDGKEYVFDSSCNGVLKEEEPEEIKVTEITVSGQTEMYVGDTQKLEAAVLPENASDKKVTWTSDNEEIITTTEDGSGVKGTIQIAVEETIVEAESLTITGIEGDTLHLTEAG